MTIVLFNLYTGFIVPRFIKTLLSTLPKGKSRKFHIRSDEQKRTRVIDTVMRSIVLNKPV